MPKESTKIEFSKIIYFDEESATDLIYMYNKGQLIATLTENNEDGVDSKIEVGSEAGVRTNIFSIFKLGARIESAASFSANSAKLVNQAITNTVLTDYLEIASEEKSVNIEKFNSARVYAYKNSMTFYKLMTPFFTMTEGKYLAGDIQINISLMDEALKQGRGYFEMILDDSDQKKVLRFNLNSFKSSYSLSDLVKMDLTYHAVSVGKMNLSDLDFSKEFEFNRDIKKNIKIDIEKVISDEQYNPTEDDSDTAIVFDVILAGVKND